MILMVLLSLAGLLRLVLIIAVVVLAIRLITLMVLPHVMNKAARHMQDQMDALRRAQQQQGRKEGDISISRPGRDADKGEFTDYTEVKD